MEFTIRQQSLASVALPLVGDTTITVKGSQKWKQMNDAKQCMVLGMFLPSRKCRDGGRDWVSQLRTAAGWDYWRVYLCKEASGACSLRSPAPWCPLVVLFSILLLALCISRNIRCTFLRGAHTAHMHVAWVGWCVSCVMLGGGCICFANKHMIHVGLFLVFPGVSSWPQGISPFKVATERA